MEDAGEGTYVYTGTPEGEVAAGSLLVRDAAGNVWISEEAYGDSGGDFGGMGGMGGISGGFGGSGGSSADTRTVSHSSSSTQSTTAYGAVALEVEEGSMYELTLGGQALPLTLTLDYDAGGVEEEAADFTAELAVWNGGGDESDENRRMTR